MPGVKTGDMGPKFGYHSKDNGWMTLKDVKVPRSYLLQRYFTVDRDGAFSIGGDLRVLYSVMSGVRSMLVNGTALIQ
jgi:acyl-CoA oxidase